MIKKKVFFKKIQLAKVDGYEKMLTTTPCGDPYLDWRNHRLDPIKKVENVILLFKNVFKKV